MQQVKLNIIPGQVSPRIHVSQYDVGRQFAFELCEDLVSFSIPSGSTVTIQGTKEDRHAFSYGTGDGVVSVSGSTVTITTTYQMTVCAGITECELKIVTSSYEIYTCNFVIEVEESALPDDGELSESDIPLLKKAIDAGDNAEEALKNANAALEAATDAKSKADDFANTYDDTKTKVDNLSTTVGELKADSTKIEDNFQSLENAVDAAARAEDAKTSAEAAVLEAKDYADKASSTVTGVGSFNNRTGAIEPQSGDYTAEMVGAYDKAHIDSLHTTTAFKLLASNWSTTTTEVDGKSYYTYTLKGLALNDVFPLIHVGASGTVPTETEQKAYNCVEYADTSDEAITFYASTKPTVDIPLFIKGAAVTDSWDSIAELVSTGEASSFFQ